MNLTGRLVMIILLFSGLSGCGRTGQEEMVRVLHTLEKDYAVRDNFFCPEAKVIYYDSLILASTNDEQIFTNSYFKAYFLLQAGEPEQAIEIYENLLKRMAPDKKEAIHLVNQYLGVSYLRLGEQVNCVSNKTAESCIFPIQGTGIHKDNLGSKNAIKQFEAALRLVPDDLETRWLLNIAYMTLGHYPDSVPKYFLIPGLSEKDSSDVKPFEEISTSLGLTERNMSGGVIAEDFDLDGDIDIATSAWGLDEPMHYYTNNGDGSFTDNSIKSNLHELTGGLNMTQTDFNNDGYADIFVMRGGWMAKYGRQPNSLLQNNRDGTFTDVTFKSGMDSYFPTQAATWNDFNNDGWLDVFIGNESMNMVDLYPCELYINQKNGTFKNVAAMAGVNIINYVKAVSSGDYDNDGWTDIFISTMNRKSYLLRNQGMENGNIKFEDVSEKAGFANQISKTFPTWFWDYNNDGFLDIFLCSFEFTKSLGYYEAAERLQMPMMEESKMKLYRNNGDGTFTNVAAEAGLDRVVNAMGSNFGDINNDGFPDFYMGTGNPDTKSLIPDRLFKNENGQYFKDVTSAARVGHLQKGHGIAFADMDFDGDQDIFMEVGGSFKGESFQNSFYLNPGQGDNNWIGIKLEGVHANRLAIGSRIKLTFKENNEERSVYRDINSGGCFGSSPILAQIGVGQAKVIDRIEIRWSGSNIKQEFKNIKPNQFLRITEGNSEPEILSRPKINFTK